MSKVLLKGFGTICSEGAMMKAVIHKPACWYCSQVAVDEHVNKYTIVQKMVARTRGERLKLVKKRPDSPPDSEQLNVAIIGTPNAGKSTLTNKLMGWRITSVSQKVHTTREKIVGVFTEDEKQLIFLDTPGIVPVSAKKRHHLEESLITDPFRVLELADMIAVVVDVSNKYTRTHLDKLILKALLLNPNKKSVLILNKVDAIRKKDVLLTLTKTLTLGQVGGQKVSSKPPSSTKKIKLQKLIENMDSHMPKSQNSESREQISDVDCQNVEDNDASGKSITELVDSEEDSEKRMKLINRLIRHEHGWANFDQVFMVSALHAEGVRELKDYLLSSTKPQQWTYHSTMVTDQDPAAIVKMCVWEKLLEHLPKDIPYNIRVEVPLLEVTDEGLYQIVVTLWCKDRRHIVYVIGKGGNVVKQISEEAKQEILNTFRCDVKLKLIVKEEYKM